MAAGEVELLAFSGDSRPEMKETPLPRLSRDPEGFKGAAPLLAQVE